MGDDDEANEEVEDSSEMLYYRCGVCFCDVASIHAIFTGFVINSMLAETNAKN